MASMQRGHDGRIEAAFAAAKERGEAAFVAFVTAGFPVKEGEIIWKGEMMRVRFCSTIS